jgi:peptidoglycan/LPS O-acetylase OafA/YrhL
MRIVGNHALPQYMLDQEVLYRWTPFRIDALLLGGFVALVQRGPSLRRLLMAARVGFGILFSVLLVSLSYAVLHRHEGWGHPAWKFTWGLVFADFFSACLIVMALNTGSITFRIFSMRPLRWLGRISYGAYVFHDIPHAEIQRFVTRYYLDPYGFVTAAIAIGYTLLFSWASFRWFEGPFIRLKERWTRVSPRAVADTCHARLERAEGNVVA